MAAMRHFILIILAIGCGCRGHGDDRAGSPVAATRPAVATRPSELARIEFAMNPGQAITATTATGTIKIYADDWLKRSYTWEGITRSVVMWPRDDRWYGSLGVYFPGPGRHWEEHNGITRGVLEEGQQHFGLTDEALDWIHKRSELEGVPYVYNGNGIVVGWGKRLEREQLNVQVWQVLVNGEKPSHLPGATDAAIRILPP